MGSSTRTAAHIEADRIDSDMVRLSNRIQAFGEEHLRGSSGKDANLPQPSSNWQVSE